MTLSLYELNPAYRPLSNLPGEVTEQTTVLEDAVTLECLLESIQEDRSTKILSLAKLVLGLEAEATLLEEQAGRLTARARSRRRRVEFLRRWMKLGLEASNISRVRDSFVTAWLQTSPPSVEVVDDQAIPAEYQRAVLRMPLSLVPRGMRGYLQHLDIDKMAILARVKQTGEIVPGVLVHTGEKHLHIR